MCTVAALGLLWLGYSVRRLRLCRMLLDPWLFLSRRLDSDLWWRSRSSELGTQKCFSGRERNCDCCHKGAASSWKSAIAKGSIGNGKQHPQAVSCRR